MGGSVRPEPDLDSLIAARRKALSGEPDLDSLIAARRRALGSTENGRPDIENRVMDAIGGALGNIVTHPIETAKAAVAAPFKSFADAVLSPSVGEARHSPNLSKGGNSAGLTAAQIAQPYDAEHGAVTGKQRGAAAAQTFANVLFPSIVGGVSSRLAASGAPAAVSRILGTSAAGATAGAAYSPDDPLVGGIAGGVLAPTLGEVVRGAGKAGGKAVTTLGLRPTGRTAAEIAQDAATMRTPIGPEAATATPAAEVNAGTRAPMSPPGTAPTPTTGQRARAVFGRGVQAAGVEPSKTLALREFARRLEADNVSPADAVAFAQANAGKPVAALDLGSGNVAGLARTAKDVPGLGRRLIPQFLEERSAGNDGATLQRITQDFEHRIGLAPEDYYATVEDMTGKMKARAKTDYDKIRGTVVDDPEVLSLFDEPEFQAIHERIRANARLGGKGKIPPLSTVEEIGGEKVRTLNPQTLGTLDLMKRQLDKIIAGKSDAVGSVDRDLAYNMRDRLGAILDRMDELYPEYGKARSEYRGSAEAIDAYEQGKTEFMKLDPRAIKAKLDKMPPRLQDLYRRGGYDALRSNKLTRMDDGANIGQFLEKNPDIRDRVAALAKTPEDAAALRGDLGTERAMGKRKEFILGGPNTAERIIEFQNTVPRVTQLGNLARNLPAVGKLAGGLIDNSITRRTANQTGDVMGEAAKILVSNGPSAMEQLMRAVEELRQADAAGLRRGQLGLGRRVGIVAGQSTPQRQP